MRTKAILGLALALLLSVPLLARVPGEPHPHLAFRPVPDPGPSVVWLRRPTLAPIDDRPLVALPPVRRPIVRTPRPSVIVAVRDSGRHPTVHRGLASYYCCTRGYPSGLYAAAGPALRVGHWRGRQVVVAANGHRVRVTLIDWCQCYGTRVIDLYPQVFRQLAPLSAGLVRVAVSW